MCMPRCPCPRQHFRRILQRGLGAVDHAAAASSDEGDRRWVDIWCPVRPSQECAGTLHTPLLHSSHTLLSYTPLIHSSLTLLSYTPLIHSSHHTLLSYTPLTPRIVQRRHHRGRRSAEGRASDGYAPGFGAARAW
jgi:hypothetical protein